MNREKIRALSLGPKLFTGAAVVSILIVVSLLGFFLLDRRHLDSEMIRRTELVTKIMALSNAKQIAENDIAALNDAVANIMSDMGEQGEIVYIYILDGEGTPLAQDISGKLTREEADEIFRWIHKRRLGGSTTGVIDPELTGAVAPGDDANLTQIIPPQLTRDEKTLESGRDIIDVVVPININDYSIVWGAIRVGFNLSSFYKFQETRNVVVFIVIFLVGLTIAGTLFLHRSLVVAIEEMMEDSIYQVETRYRNEINRLKKSESGAEDEEGTAQPLSGQEFFNILDIAKRIGATLDLNEVLQLSAGSIVRLMKVRILTLFLLDGQSHELVGKIGYDENGIIAEENLSSIRIKVGQGDIGLTAEFGTTTIIDEPTPGTALAAALVAKGGVLGVFLVKGKLNDRPFSKKDKLVARLISTLVANAIRNAMEHRNALLNSGNQN